MSSNNYAIKTNWLIDTWSYAKGSPEELEEARCEIISLSDLKFLQPLSEALLKRKDARELRTIYWMYSSLMCANEGTEIGQLLLDQIGLEKRKGLKGEILRRLGIEIKHGHGKRVAIKDATNAINCLADKTFRVDAVLTLGGCSDARVEGVLTEVVETVMRQANKQESNTLNSAFVSLREVGSVRSISTAVHVLESIDALPFGLKGHIKGSALQMVAVVNGAQFADLFVAYLLKDKSPEVTWHAMNALHEHATVEQATSIKQRIGVLMSSARKLVQADLFFLGTAGPNAQKTELLLAMETLSRVDQLDSDTVALLRNRWDDLTAEEQAFLHEQP